VDPEADLAVDLLFLCQAGSQTCQSPGSRGIRCPVYYRCQRQKVAYGL